MQYKYAKEQQDYSDFSSGRVFYSLPGHPAFAVRLASEIFQRCMALRKRNYDVSDPCTLYDPCCGAAYHLSVLGYLHGENIREIIGSDIDEKAIALAERNLGLLRLDRLDRRIREISELFETYGKASHQEALESASRLKTRLSTLVKRQPLETKAFHASATDNQEILKNIKPKFVDIIFTDVPYGRHSQWRDADASNPLGSMLAAFHDVLSSSSIVAIAADKRQKASHESYERLEQFQIGKRRVVILKPL